MEYYWAMLHSKESLSVLAVWLILIAATKPVKAA